MAVFYANDPCILFIGGWENGTCTQDFSRLMILFRGDFVKLSVNGDVVWSLDGSEDCTISSLTCVHGVHSLFLTAQKGAIFHTVETEDLLAVNPYLKGVMEKEYTEIRRGRRVPPPQYTPISYRAAMPKRGVTLLGTFGELFFKNVNHIKACFSKPGYVDKINTVMYYHEWLPAANDGRILGGAARAYRWTQDPELRQIVDHIVDKIEAQMRPDGFYNYYSEVDSFELTEGQNSERKNFDRTFWMFGMAAADQAGNQKALPLARRMYDWLEKSKYGPELLQSSNATNALMGTLILADTRLGKDSDLLFNQTYLDQRFWEEELIRRNPVAFSNYPGERPHCYDLLELLSLAYEYRLTGDSHYLDALLGGWDIYRRYYKHLGGDAAICESNGPYYPGTYQMDIGCTGETCGSVFWVWINAELCQLFPDDVRFAAEIEENLFNSVSSFTTEECLTRYHNRLQGTKEEGWGSGICCEVMSTLMLADLPQYVYAANEDGIWINQYLPCRVRNSLLEFDLQADLHGAQITLSSAPKREVSLKLRIPTWAENVTCFVNGETVETNRDFVGLTRVWKRGDTVELNFTPKLSWVRYKGIEQDLSGNPRYAMMYGPYMMSLTGYEGCEIPHLSASPETLSLTHESTLTLHVNNSDGLRFVPFYTIPCAQPFCTFPVFGKTPENE